MNRLKLLFLACLLCLIPLATQADTIIFVTPGASGGGDCVNRGSAAIYWDGDHSSGTDYACISGGTQQGSIVSGTVSTDQNHTAGGSYSMDSPTSNDYIVFAITGKDIFDSAEGTIDMWVYPTGHTSNTRLFYIYGNTDYANNRIYLDYISATQKIYYYHKGNSTAVTFTSTDTLTDNQWNHIEFRWSVANKKTSIKINDAGSWEDAAEESSVTAFVDAPSMGLRCGSAPDLGDLIYFDDFKCYTTMQ